jgi:hypothetical protein
MSAIAYGSGVPQPRNGLYDKMAGVENQTLSPGLEFGLELGGPMQVGQQVIDVDQSRSSPDAGRCVLYRYLRPVTYIELALPEALRCCWRNRIH